MRFLSTLPIVLIFLGSSGLHAADQPADSFYSVPGPDAPELARRGSNSVGVRTIEIVHKHQVDVLHYDKQTQTAPFYDRPLKIEIWYPASIPSGQEERTTYESSLSGRAAQPQTGIPSSFNIAGKALRDAPPVKGQRFPLVVVSHGYPGSRTFLSYLTENLASKGYVVAAIDHTDSVVGEVRGFESTLLNRSNDQLFTIEALTKLEQNSDHFLHGLFDPSTVAIVGYSMGGYGALATAGAGYSKNGIPDKLVPGGYLDAWTFANSNFVAQHRESIKAVVAIAPWGEQPPYNSWDPEALAAIRMPTLFIDGDQDDVSGYGAGVKRAFDQTVNSDRCLLVYENARHNVGGNPAPPEALGNYMTLQSFEEPVWRKNRITSINQHFITAFLDLYLKKDESKRPYLHVQPDHSNDGQWPIGPGQGDTGGFSGGDDAQGHLFWKGFERRWALGLEMHCSAPLQVSK